MLIISEWFPNPVGKDAGNEWLEIQNTGTTPLNLSGWQLRNSSGKTMFLKGVVPEDGYFLLRKGDLKITLKNGGEELILLSPDGKIADRSSYLGSAPEGLSVVSKNNISFFAKPTPGLPNPDFKAEISSSPFTPGIPLNDVSRTYSFLGMMIGTALTLALLSVYIFKLHETTNELFFGKY